MPLDTAPEKMGPTRVERGNVHRKQCNTRSPRVAAFFWRRIEGSPGGVLGRAMSRRLPLLEQPQTQHLRNIEEQMGGDDALAADQMSEGSFAEAQQPHVVCGGVDILRARAFE